MSTLLKDVSRVRPLLVLVSQLMSLFNHVRKFELSGMSRYTRAFPVIGETWKEGQKRRDGHPTERAIQQHMMNTTPSCFSAYIVQTSLFCGFMIFLGSKVCTLTLSSPLFYWCVMPEVRGRHAKLIYLSFMIMVVPPLVKLKQRKISPPSNLQIHITWVINWSWGFESWRGCVDVVEICAPRHSEGVGKIYIWRR
jgi:hypothetical protein